MLKPFQVRDLHDPQAPVASFAASSQSHAGVVQLSAPQYDSIVSTHPGATLTYMDEDDGEVIAVGSSLELAQRLDEPISVPRHLSSLSHSPPPPGDDTTPMHVFDIRRSNSVTELWKSLENTPGTNLPPPMPRDPQDKVIQEYFNACNPPQVISKGTFLRRSESLFSAATDSSHFENESVTSTLPFPSTSPPPPHSSSSSLTAEGRRQAQEAGARLRASRSIPARMSSSFMPSSTQTRGIWALPNNPLQSFSNIATKVAEDQTGKTPSPTRDEQLPFLSAFEAQMTEVMKDASQSGDIPPATDPQPATLESSDPVSVIIHGLGNIAGRVESLGTELKSKIPELERQLYNAQRVIPERLSTTFQAASATLDSHVKQLANVIQDASIATGRTADQIRQVEFPPSGQLVDGLGAILRGLTQLSQSLLTTFEAETVRGSPSNQNDSSIYETSANAQAEKPGTGQRAGGHGMKNPLFGNPNSAATYDGVPNRPELAASQPPRKLNQISSQLPNELPKRSSSVSRVPPPPPPPPATYWTQPGFSAGWYRPPPKSWTTSQSYWPNPLHSVARPPPPPPIHQSPWFSHPPSPIFQLSSPHPSPIIPISSLYTDSSNGTSQNKLEPRTVESINDTLFIGNVGFGVTEKTIRDVFASRGFLAEVHLPIDSTAGKHAGFGYIRFPSTHSARAALEALQGALVDGHSINLEFSHTPPIRASQAPSGTTSTPNEPSAITATSSQDSTREQSYSHRLRHYRSWHPGTRGSVPFESQRASFSRNVSPVNISRSLVAPDDASTFPKAGKFKQGSLSSTNENSVGNVHVLLNSSSEDNSKHARHEAKVAVVQQAGSDKNGHVPDKVNDSIQSSAHHPSRFPNEGTKADTALAPDRLLTLSPNSEMARFPPVSQLDAHLAARQYRQYLHWRNKRPANLGTRDIQCDMGEKDKPNHEPTSRDESPATASESSSRMRQSRQELHDELPNRRADNSLISPTVGDNPNPSHPDQNRLRRSHPMMIAGSVARLTSPFDPLIPHDSATPSTSLRRSATEGHPRRDRTREGRFSGRLLGGDPTWAVPGSFPVDEPAVSRSQQGTAPAAAPNRPLRFTFAPAGDVLDADMQTAIQRSIIDNCVDTLVNLGYGRVQDGGRQRLTVYAEAAEGKVDEAVEMIEEERKAYAQKRRTTYK